MNRIQQIKTIALTAIAPIVWGSTYIVTTEALPPDSPLIASTIRALPAGVLLVLISRACPTGLWWHRMAVLGFLKKGKACGPDSVPAELWVAMAEDDEALQHLLLVCNAA